MNPTALTASTSDNALLAISAHELAPFDRIRPEHIAPALDELLVTAQAALNTCTAPDFPADPQRLEAILDVATERLSRAWSAVGHLNGVADTPELRAAYNEQLPRVTEFHTSIGSNEALFEKYRAVMQQHGAQLEPAKHRALSLALRDFVLGGAELQGEAKARFAELQDQLAQAAQTFSEHVLDATDAFSYLASPDEAAGLPPDVLAATQEAAHSKGLTGHLLTLHAPCYVPVMQYAHSRELRAKLYRAYVTRASDLGAPEHDNSALMHQLLALKIEEAKLLGHTSPAQLSLATKMAPSPEAVETFLLDLAARARPHAERDLNELRDFARTELGMDDLQAWDMAYASEKLKEARFAFSEQELKAYFTEPQVLKGLFGLIERLFHVSIQPDQATVWHPSVRFFKLIRGDRLIGQFYLDLYARPGKRPGAWMDDARGRWQRPDAGLQTPVAHLVCNFASPVGDQPALLTHDDVITLFHEFGHGLHHLLTQVDELSVSGISGVEWDAVELPSQFMENLAWEWEVLQTLTEHVSTKSPLPRALFDKMIAAKNFQSGLQTLRQVEFALFDMRLHGHQDASKVNVQAELDAVRKQVAVVQAPEFNRFAHTFSHIFAGGYSAGYYSYKWAELLSADAWSAFEEAAQAGGSVLDAETGARFCTKCWKWAAAGELCRAFKPSAVVNPVSMRCFAIKAWLEVPRGRG